jgi:antitoxin component HigA of HigAB toxin-antitoxin module
LKNGKEKIIASIDMKTHFDIEKIVEKGSITNELDYERAMIADRKLRLLSKENSHFKNMRRKLRDVIEAYEKKEWSNEASISPEKIQENIKSERIAELERLFIENRRQEIKKKLKEFDLKQEDLCLILGHKSKTHMSELINGIKPFTLKDLVIINRILKIDLNHLVPNFLSDEDKQKIKDVVKSLAKPKLKLTSDDWVIS